MNNINNIIVTKITQPLGQAAQQVKKGLLKATDGGKRFVAVITELTLQIKNYDTRLSGKLINRDISVIASRKSTNSEIMPPHTVCLNQKNAPEGYNRVYVPVDKIGWDKNLKNYEPTEFTNKTLLEIPAPAYADPENPREVDWGDRFHCSHTGKVKFADGKPLNPIGRTGTEGRGELGKWGPNHAADPVITRYNQKGNLELLLIQRKDNGQWALPGGMVDVDDPNFSTTALRELAEEALNSEEALDEDMKLQLEDLKEKLEKENELRGENERKVKEELEEHIKKEVASLRNSLVCEKIIKELPEFKNAKEIFKGYVDDRRNTDNAWMETTAYHIHVSKENRYLNNPVAGDDAKKAKWIEVTPKTINMLYASHADIVKKVQSISAAVGESQ